MLVCTVTAKGAPGATTSALAMAMTWPQPVLMVEGDPAGGDLRSGFLHGTDAGERNLLQLAKLARHGLTPADMARQCLALDAPEATRLVLPGLPNPFQGAALEALWEPLLQAANEFWVRDPIWAKPVDIIIDCGRLDHPHMPWRLIEAADLVVLVFRATLPSVGAARSRAEHLRRCLENATSRPEALVGLLVTEGSYGASEMREIGIDVAATLPYDPAAARVLSEGTPAPRGFQRGQLVRAAHAAAMELRARCPETTAQHEPETTARYEDETGPKAPVTGTHYVAEATADVGL